LDKKIAVKSLGCVPCLTGLVANVLPRRVIFDPRPLRVRYMTDKMTKGEVSV
jgi:hypothetical protein